MLQRIRHSIHSLIPSIKKEEGFSLDTTCIPEKVFYNVVDCARSSLHIKIDREKAPLFDRFVVDTALFFWVFFSLCYAFYYLPMYYLTNEPSKNSIFGQLFIIVFLVSLLWAGYIYIIQSFKNLTREFFLPVVEKNPHVRFNFPKLFRQFFRGWRIEWNSGFGLNVYLKSSLIGTFLIGYFVYSTMNSMSELISGVIFSHSLEALISLYVSIIIIGIGFIVVFFVFLTLLSVLVIFFYLLFAVRLLPLEINSFQDMGGTGQFGKIIINSIYLISVAFGTIPVFPLIVNLDLSSFRVPLPGGTLGNATTLLKGELVNSINAVSIDSFSKYVGYIESFFVFIALAFVLIIALHYRIKRSKEEKLSQLERIISDIDFNDPENKENNLYYLSLYEKVLSTNEWPIKKIFVLELVISALPLFISFLLP